MTGDRGKKPDVDRPVSQRVRRSRRPTVCFDPAKLSRLTCESKDCKTIGKVAGARVHWPGRSLNMCVACTVRATNVATHMGFTLTCEPLVPNPQPPCQGCGSEVIDCGPALWMQGKKCCPDCTHGMDGPNEEYEPEGSP